MDPPALPLSPSESPHQRKTSLVAKEQFGEWEHRKTLKSNIPYHGHHGKSNDVEPQSGSIWTGTSGNVATQGLFSVDTISMEQFCRAATFHRACASTHHAEW